MSPTVFREGPFRFYFFSRENLACTFMFVARMVKPSSGLRRIWNWRRISD